MDEKEIVARRKAAADFLDYYEKRCGLVVDSLQRKNINFCGSWRGFLSSGHRLSPLSRGRWLDPQGNGRWPPFKQRDGYLMFTSVTIQDINR